MPPRLILRLTVLALLFLPMLSARGQKGIEVLGNSATILPGQKIVPKKTITRLSNSPVKQSPTQVCNTTTFFMHVPAPAGHKIWMKELQVNASGNFIAVGNIELPGGEKEALVTKINNAGDIITQKRYRVNNKQISVEDAKIAPDGNIFITGIIKDGADSVFLLKLNSDLSFNQASTYKLMIASLDLPVSRVTLSIFKDTSIALAAQVGLYINYSLLKMDGTILWNHYLASLNNTLLSFKGMGNDDLGIVLNTIQAGKQLTEIWKVDGMNGYITPNYFLRDGVTEIKSLDATFFNGRMITFGITNELSSGTMKPVRDILAQSTKVEVTHTFSQLGTYDFSVTGAIDNTGDAMAICKPQQGKLLFIKHFSTYQTTTDFVKEYDVPVGSSAFGTSKTSDGGFVFGINGPADAEFILIKTDSIGTLSGCTSNSMVPVTQETMMTNNKFSQGLASVILPPTKTIIPVMTNDVSLTTQFDCRQNYCPPAPPEDTCMATYYKTYKSPSYIDFLSEHYLVRGNRQLSITMRYDRTAGDATTVINTLKLFDERGNFIKGVNLTNGVNVMSFFGRQLDDSTIALISNVSSGNLQRYSITLVSDNLEVIWSKVLENPNSEFYSGGSGIGDVVRDTDGSIYVVSTRPGFFSAARVSAIKLDASGNLIWSKVYDTKDVYWLTVEAAITPQDLVLIIEPGFTARLNKATGNILNGYEFMVNSDGLIYQRTVKYDQGRIFYLGNDEGEFLMMLFDSTGKPYRQRKSNLISSFARASIVKDGHLFISHTYYRDAAATQVLMKVDTALNIVFMNEYPLERSRTARGMGVSEEGNIYIGGVFGYGGVNGTYYDPYIQKYNANGELGTCSFIPSTQPLIEWPLQPVPLAFTPGTMSLQIQNFPAMVVPDDIGLSVDLLLCSSTPLCTTVDLIDPGPVCRQQVDYVIRYQTNAGCNLKPIFSYDTSIAKLQSINDTAAIFRFKKLGSVWIAAKLNTGCKTYYDSILVNVQNSPSSFSIGADTLVCPGDSIVLHAGRGFNSYRWQDGSTDSIFIARTTGVYHVQATNACGDIYNDTIVISGAIVPPLSLGNDRLVCISDTILIQANPGFVNYQWTAQQPFIVQPASILMVVNQSDQVMLRARTADGCYAKDTILINTISALPVSLGADASFCEYDSIAINAGTGYLQYNWNTGETTPSIVVNKRGSYYVTVKDPNGCFARDTMRVIQTYTRPLVSLGKDGPICASNSIQFNAGNYASYLWQDGSTSRSYSTSQTGTYWVNVTDLNGCAGGDTIVVTQLLPLPANFLKAVDTFCQYDKLTIVPVGKYSTYNWSNGTNSTNLITDKPGIYSLTVVDSKGCTGSDTIKVVQKDCLFGVYIPNAFTPNSDGHNDQFRARVYGNALSFSLQVFNRYGQLVFSTKDPHQSWNGLIGGTAASPGNYAWKCEYHLQGSKPTAEKGFVILIR